MGAYLDRVLQDSPSSLWPLNETSGSAADDVRSNNYDGTATGLTWGASGPVTDVTAASFNSTDRVDVGDHYGFTGTGSFTMSAWIKPSNVTGGKRIIQKCDSNSPYKGWQWYLNGNVQEFERDGGSAPYYSTLTGSTTISASTWTHVAVTYDGTHLRFYKNGVIDAAGAISNTRSIASTTNTCIIGNFISPYSYPMTGDMCYVAVWDGSALSAATLLAHYNAMYIRTGSDSWAWSDVALKGDSIEGGLSILSRTTSDTWAWSDAAAPRAAPAARTAVGSRVAVFTSNGSVGTFGAHYAFASTIMLPDGKTLLCVARKATDHASYDGILVGKTSTDDGATWGSEFTIISESGWDWRDGYPVVLASGRIGMTGERRKTSGGFDFSQVPFMYTDDPTGLTGWSSPTLLSNTETGVFSGTLGSVAGCAYGSDLIEMSNGDLWIYGYGIHASGSSAYDLFATKSTDDGATWTAQSSPALASDFAGVSVVEPQAELLSNGDVYLTFHTEDGLPTDWYRTRWTGGAWTDPVQMGDENSFNRQGLSVFDDDRLIVSVNTYPGYGFSYYESYNGNLFGSAVVVDTNQPVASYSSNLWLMVTALAGTGESQNVGFTYGAEVAAQNKASVWWRQFTGTDGTTVYRRGSSDSWAWSDTAVRSATTWARSTTDSWAWSDSAAKSPQTFTRLTIEHPTSGANSEYWSWSDVAIPNATSTYARSTSDTWAWSDAASQSTGGPAARTASDTWAWSDALARSLAASRTTSDLWRWTEPSTNPSNPLFWLMARARRRTMSAPTKTYKVVQPKGTTKTSTWTSETYVAQTEAGILVVLDVTAASGSGGLTLRINAHDQASSQAVPLNSAPTAITATGTTSYALYPFGAVAGNVTQATEFYLPRMFSISVTHGDSSSYTYSVGFCLLP